LLLELQLVCVELAAQLVLLARQLLQGLLQPCVQPLVVSLRKVVQKRSATAASKVSMQA
jgi:hypothetical protein